MDELLAAGWTVEQYNEMMEALHADAPSWVCESLDEPQGMDQREAYFATMGESYDDC